MIKRSFSVAVLSAFLVIGSQAAFAQDTLRGGVQMHVDPSMRIDRSTLRKMSTGVQSSEFRTDLIPQQAQTAPLIDPGVFQATATQIQKPAPLLQTAATKTDTTLDKPAPYIWYQSAMGGYFDGSGTTKDLVRANRLYLYGGKFADGTPVPKTEIRDYNEMGHAYRGSRLNTAHFWSH